MTSFGCVKMTSVSGTFDVFHGVMSFINVTKIYKTLYFMILVLPGLSFVSYVLHFLCMLNLTVLIFLFVIRIEGLITEVDSVINSIVFFAFRYSIRVYIEAIIVSFYTLVVFSIYSIISVSLLKYFDNFLNIIERFRCCWTYPSDELP